jgi:hypothetical protein
MIPYFQNGGSCGSCTDYGKCLVYAALWRADFKGGSFPGAMKKERECSVKKSEDL